MTPALPWEVIEPAMSQDDPYLRWSPVPSAICESVARQVFTNLNTVITNGQMECTSLTIPPGKTVSRVSFITGSSVPAALTNQWCALIDATTLAPLLLTAEEIGAAWPISSLVTLNFTAQYMNRGNVGQRVYAGIVQVGAATTNSFRGASSVGAPNVFPPPLGGLSSAGLVGPGTCPNPVALPAGSINMLYAALS